MSDLKSPQEQGPPVVLKMSDARLKAKKDAAKATANFSAIASEKKSRLKVDPFVTQTLPTHLLKTKKRSRL